MDGSQTVEGMRRRAFVIEHLVPRERDMEIISYELKYCERCGTLKLRPIDSGSTYCRHCEGMLARYTFPQGKRGKDLATRPSAPETAILVQIPLRCVSHRVAEVAK